MVCRSFAARVHFVSAFGGPSEVDARSGRARLSGVVAAPGIHCDAESWEEIFGKEETSEQSGASRFGSVERCLGLGYHAARFAAAGPWEWRRKTMIPWEEK